MIKAIIFDMGGVMLQNRMTNVYLQLAIDLGVDGQLLVQLVKDNRQSFMDGTYSGEGFAAFIKEQYNLSVKIEDIVGWWRQAFSDLMQVNRELYEVLPKLSQHYIVCMVTDVPALHAQINRERQLYAPFKPCILSCEVGLVKPQVEMYQLAIKQLALEPSECIFIDDKQGNIEAANKLGFKTILFENNQQFLNDLRNFGVNY